MNAFSPRWPWWLTALAGAAVVLWLVVGTSPGHDLFPLARGAVVLLFLLAVDFAWTLWRAKNR